MHSDTRRQANIRLGIIAIVGQPSADVVDFGDAPAEALSDRDADSSANLHCEAICRRSHRLARWKDAVEGLDEAEEGLGVSGRANPGFEGVAWPGDDGELFEVNSGIDCIGRLEIEVHCKAEALELITELVDSGGRDAIHQLPSTTGILAPCEA